MSDEHSDNVQQDYQPGVVGFACEHGDRHCHEQAQHIAEDNIADTF